MEEPKRGDTAICVCGKPIIFDQYARSTGPVTWRHVMHYGGGYASCGVRFAKPRPEIVVLCGSTRFFNEFQKANYDLTMAGKIVLSVGFYPHSSKESGHGEGVGHDGPEKIKLDELHKHKIDIADRVLVLNVNGYVGSSTASEIMYAVTAGKPVDYLEEPT